MIEWVQLLAEQLAVVIQNARLYSSLNQRERDLRRISEELRATRDSANQMVQAKSSFLARVSHELRTPLNAILGYTELLREDAEINRHPTMGSDLAKVQSAANSLMDIIKDLLDLSTIEAGKAQVRHDIMELPPVVREAIQRSHRSFEKRGNSVTVEYPDAENPRCYGDPAKLRQALVTVLAFASRLSTGRVLTLTVRVHDSAEQAVAELVLLQPAVALDAEQLNRLFHTFHENETASDEIGSTSGSSNKGLGLTIAQHLCRRMGGELAAFGDPAHGTAFVIRLPAVVPAYGG
jgi:signal transduction histidine kinase